MEKRKRRTYHPDILVEYKDGNVYLEEVKGHTWDKLNFSAKNVAAFLFCASRGMTYRLIFKEQLEIVD